MAKRAPIAAGKCQGGFGASLVTRIMGMSTTYRLLGGWLITLLAVNLAAAADGVPWQTNLDTGKRLAAQSGRLVLVHFWAPWCRPCMRMEGEVFLRPETARGLEANFVPVKLNVDDSQAIARLYGVSMLPADVILTPTGQLVAQLQSPPTASQYVNQLNQLAGGYKQMHRMPTLPAGAHPPVMSQTSVAQSSTSQTSTSQPQVVQGPAAQTQRPAPLATSSMQASAAAIPPSVSLGAPMVGPGANAMPPGSNPYASMGTSAQSAVGPPTSASAERVQLPPGSPPLGLDGYCPVNLLEHRAWKKGDTHWGAVHSGRTYLFGGPEEQKKFLASPNAYSPVIAGDDPVRALDEQQQVAGKREYGVYYQNRVYLFADPTSRDRFSQNPTRYAAEIVQATRKDGTARLGMPR